MLTLLLALTAAPAHAADCASHPMFVAGTTLTVGSFDAKGKADGQSVTHTTTVDASGGNPVATVHADVTDAKGKPAGVLDYTATCEATGVKLSAQAFFPSDQLADFKDQKATIEASDVVYPEGMTAGQALPDAHVTFTFVPEGVTDAALATKVGVALTGRTVDGPEKVTTEAGSFDAIKLHYTATTTLTTVVSVKFTVDVVEWYAPGVGTVKSETARKGKPAGSSRLLAMTKG